MFKKIFFHALVGGSLFILGVILHDFADIKGLGNFLAYGGMVYVGATTLLILLGINPIPPSLNKIGEDFSKKKARQELLECKKLLDEGVLSQEEFEAKVSELKKIIL